MLKKIIAQPQRPVWGNSPKHPQQETWLPSRKEQRGVTLIELMVGLMLGLMVVAVAIGVLMVSRTVTGTVSDVSDIQQQGAYALRVIGMQVRQAGSLYLNMNPSNTNVENLLTAPVAFETIIPASGLMSGFDPSKDTISGASNPVTLRVNYRRYKESVHIDANELSLARNCIGSPSNDKDDRIIENIFKFQNNKLSCGGNGAFEQPIINNVADFQIRYLVQDNTSTPGNPKIKYSTLDSIGSEDWPKVQAIEVCLIIYGSEPVDMPSGSSYTGCDGSSQVDMTTLTGERARRMHIPFRNTFQLRSQGLVGSVL